MVPDGYSLPPRPTFGLGAVLAILAALGGMVASCGGHPFWGLILAILAIPLGALGLLQSTARRLRGGFVSLLAIVLAAIGILVALLVLVFKIVLWPL